MATDDLALPASARTGLVERRAPAALDLQEGIDTHLQDRRLGCPRWPEGWYLVNTLTGEAICGLCRATNLCPYCRTRYVVETAEMLALDACEHAPTLWIVLTAREHLTRAQCRRHLDMLLRQLRKRWPVEWFVQVEFQRRGALHLNLLVKGVPVDDLDNLHRAISDAWCRRVDALPVGQWAGAVQDGSGVLSYLTTTLVHGLKSEQAPPLGWKGHRTSQTRGYLVRPASVMREEARRSLRLKRLLWQGWSVDDAALELVARDAIAWTMRRANPSTVVLA